MSRVASTYLSLWLILGSGVLLFSSCHHPEKTGSSLGSEAADAAAASYVTLGLTPEVLTETRLPQRFGDSAARAAKVESLTLEAELVRSAVTVRPRTEVREGPGVAFLLSEALLPAGERVLVYELVGVWRRIVAPGRGVRGWVHRGALRFDRHAERPRDAKLKLSVSPTLLPLVFAARPVTQVYLYPGLQPTKTEIPAGSAFFLLKEASGRKLIWLSETNSVVWVNAKEMQ